MARHTARQAQFKGNPRFFSTYTDEGLNKGIIKIASGCHRRTLQRRTHQKYEKYAQARSANECEWM